MQEKVAPGAQTPWLLQLPNPLGDGPSRHCAVPQLPHPVVCAPTHWHPSFGVPLQVASSPDEQPSWAAGATLHGPQFPLPSQVVVPLAQLPLVPSAIPHDCVSPELQ